MTKWPSLAEQVIEVLESFNENSRLVLQLGIHCPPDCGVCCEFHEVDASVLELLPLAEYLWQNQLAEKTLILAEANLFESVCIFYRKNGVSSEQPGCCGIYEFRPSLCRLFGNCAVKDKNGALQFAACRVIKQTSPRQLLALKQQMEQGFKIQVFSDATSRLVSIDPPLGTRRLPINQAILAALEKVGMHRYWATEEE